MRLEEAKKILKQARRRDIRYVIYRLKDGTASRSDMPHKKLLKAAERWYPRLLKRLGITGNIWEGFAEEWDIGIDDSYTLKTRWKNHLDKQWYAMGISKLQVVKNPGPPTVAWPFGNEDVKIQVTPARFFQVNGYAKTGDHGIVPDVERFLEGAEKRESWVE